MTLRRKILFFLTAVLAGVSMLLFVCIRQIMLISYTQLEEDEARRCVGQVIRAIQGEQDHLLNIGSELADAGIEPVMDASPTSERLKAVLHRSKLDLIAVTAPSGETSSSVAYDPSIGREVSLPRRFPPGPARGNGPPVHGLPADAYTGLVMIGETPVLLAVVPIPGSSGRPARIMTVGRFLDADMMERLQGVTGTEFSLTRFDRGDPSLPYLPAYGSVTAKPIDAEEMEAFTVLTGIGASPDLLLRTEISRSIYGQTRWSTRYVLAALILIGVVAGVVTLILLERLVIDRIAGLSKAVREIAAAGDPTVSVPVQGCDEVAELAVGVNKMLSALSQSRSALDLERRQLLSIFDSLDESVYVVDPETYEVLYINQALQAKHGPAVGRKCYEAFQGLDKPCSFCTNKRLFGTDSISAYRWEIQNRIDHRWYRCLDKVIRWPDGRLVRCELAFDITENKLMEETLRRRFELEKTIANISAGFINIDFDAYEEAIRQALAEIGELIGVERGYLYNAEQGEAEMVFEWRLPGAVPPGRDYRDLSARAAAWWTEVLRRREPICIQAAAAKADPVMERILAERGATSILLVPMPDGEDAKGFLAFESVRAERDWPPEQIALLRIAAEIFSHAFQHRRTAAELIANEGKSRNLAEVWQQAVKGITYAMGKIVETKDPYTAGHQMRVAQLAVAIAYEMGLSSDRVAAIQTAAIIHDIGKIFIPVEILSKPGQLSDSEFCLIETHPEAGYSILKGVEFPWPVAEIVRQHHERMDGKGYPAGLSGEEILLEARIIGVADVVEAMASDRPYRPAVGLENAFDEIERHQGKIYDAEVVAACLRLFREKGFVFNGWTAAAGD